MLTSAFSITKYTDYEYRSWGEKLIENVIRYKGIKRERIECQKALHKIVHAMSLIVEIRDPYTAGHQRRVAKLACAIARGMGLPEHDVIDIQIAGLIHDIGKLAVPAEILSKPGKINHCEFSIIKNHPQIGHEILEKIEFPRPVTQSILQHHERLNGSGYPMGLFGEDITLEARILAVADVVEAMSSHRPYRPALGLNRALEEIYLNSEIFYDSKVVNTCLKLFQNDELKFERLMEATVNQYI